MLKPFLIIKTHEGDYFRKLYATLLEANAAVNPSDDFPGDYICSYNLETERYIHIEHFPGGINNAIHTIIEENKVKFREAAL